MWALKGHLRLWVPEVVIREATRHYIAQLNLHLGKLRDVEDALGKLSFRGGPQPAIQDHRDKAAALIAGYEQRLRDLLGQAGAAILPLPRMSHNAMPRRPSCE